MAETEDEQAQAPQTEKEDKIPAQEIGPIGIMDSILNLCTKAQDSLKSDIQLLAMRHSAM